MGAQGSVRTVMCAILLLLMLSGCGGGTAPRMEWGSEDFMGFPWPNDLRRHPDGTVNLEGFPGTGNPLLKAVLNKGEPYMHGFGTTSGVLFQFDGPLNPSSIPLAPHTQGDDSALMLVNLDTDSPLYLQRIPVRAHFDPLTTLYQPGHLLTLLPVPGYALEPDTLYGALLFNGILDADSAPIKPAPLVSALYAGQQPGGMDAGTWRTLQQQWDSVAGYVTSHTAWNLDQVAAFTVYRTMDPTAYARPVAQAIAALDDETIINSVSIVNDGMFCGYYSHLPLDAVVDLPVWQVGIHPFTLSGGMIQVDETALKAVQQGVESVGMAIHIGCSGGATPKVPMVVAQGTGADFQSAWLITGSYYDGGYFDHLALSVAPHHSGDRTSPFLEDFDAFLQNFNVNLNTSDLQGVTFYNLLNPAANIGNHIQSAADQLYLRRVAVLLPEILRRSHIANKPLNFDFSTFSVRDDVAVLAGHSQGASIVPLAMAMDHHFNTGLLSGAASLAYTQAVHRGSVRKVLPFLLAGLVENEVDYHHPLMQVLEMMHDPANSVNYAPLMQPDFLMQVAGYDDECVAREGSAALALALYRAGFMAPAERVTWHFNFFDPDGVLGLTEEDDVLFPVTEPNLPNGGLGLFIQAEGGHDWYSIVNSGYDFLRRATGSVPDQSIRRPKNSNISWGCDVRYEEGA